MEDSQGNQLPPDARGLHREHLATGAAYLVREPVGRDDEMVLFIHGLGSTGAAWLPVGRCAPGRTGLLLPDLPGFGGSPSAPNLTPLEAATEVVSDLLRIYTKRFRVKVVAHSVGSIVALGALKQVEAQRVHRLVLVAGTLVSATRVFATAHAMAARPTLSATVGVHVLAGVVPLDMRGARTIARHRALRTALLWPFIAQPQGVSEGNLLAGLPHRGGVESLRAIWSARDIDLKTLMAQNHVATRIVHGERDRLIQGGDVDAACALLRPDQVTALKGCGHWPHIERARQTADTVYAA